MTSRDRMMEFSNLVRTHLNSVIRYVSFLSRESEEAKDIAQEVFLKAWQQFDPNRMNSFKTWIMVITRNHLIDRHRRRGAEVSYIGECPDSFSSNSAGEVNAREAYDEFCPEGLPAFAKLPVQYREIVFMRYVEQISYADMSKITGKSEEALRKIVSRAILTIKKGGTHGAMQQGS
jgi:RNA polymerase sigma-70 factor (ECF subfamily)